MAGNLWNSLALPKLIWGVAVPHEKLEDVARAHFAAPPEDGQIGQIDSYLDSPIARDEAVLIRRNAELAAELADQIARRDAFLAIAGHELRNPMTPILGKVQILRRGFRKGSVQPDKIEQGLQELEWLLVRYIRRATTLLDISRIAESNLKPEPTATDICKLVSDVAANLSNLAWQSGSTLQCIVPAEQIVGAWDSLVLEQILDNLLTNAIRYGESRPIEVKLGAEGHHVVLRVMDRGCGILPEDQNRIFDGFKRNSASDGARTGLDTGLCLAKRLATAMGGCIDVSSVPKQGSVFKLTLPRKSPQVEHERSGLP